MKAFIPRIAAFCAAVLVSFAARAEEGILLSYHGDGSYVFVEKTDLRRYDNGKYVGLTSREVESYIAPEKRGNATYYDGSFYVVQETKRNRHEVRQGIREAVASRFTISADGVLSLIDDNGYPSFRSFPSYPHQRINIGDSWRAEGVRVVDPLDSGIYTKIPMLVEYVYLRDEVYHGEDVSVVSGKWATRYSPAVADPAGDPSLKVAQGKHEATIIISKATGNAIVVRDTVDESFLYDGGRTVQFKGTISLFTKQPPAYNKASVITALQRMAIVTPNEAAALAEAHAVPQPKKDDFRDAARERNIAVEDTDSGLRLTVQNLQFKSDSAELLPGEVKRLDDIAAVLKEAGEAQFLVEGHTASTGSPESEQRLSEERARTIAEELAKRGIPAERFICKGSGGRKPLADNSTREGKARNRRVEITILGKEL